MPWFKVDDNLAFHSKTVAAGNAAMGLWVRAGSWSAQQLNDGFVPSHIASLLGTGQQAAKLVSAGLWTEVPGGFSFHEWEERQPKREQIENERAAARERMRLNREKRKGLQQTEGLAKGDSSPEQSRTGSDAFANPDPTRPDPTHIETPKGVSPRKRGTRLNPEFIPSEQSRQTIIAECPGIDLRKEHTKFVDYWISQPGQRGTRVDWDATWRNWMRNSTSPRNAQPAKPEPRYTPPYHGDPDDIDAYNRWYALDHSNPAVIAEFHKWYDTRHKAVS